MDLFSRSWAALLAAVAETPDEDFAEPSGCAGWLVQDLVCHLVIDAQDVLITLATPAETEPTRDAVTYWEVAEKPPTGEDDLDALIVRLAAAYQEPRLLKFHLDDVGSAAGRAAGLADPGMRVATRDIVLSAGDFLSAYVLEWTLHHLDLVAHLPHLDGPAADSLARSWSSAPARRSRRPSPTRMRCWSARAAVSRRTLRRPSSATWPRSCPSSSANPDDSRD
ncbi:maleylpyruvate isomerase [Amycolatopsis sp. WAC 01375]|nr:maleylpyruvate isomerase [Amycolatopsis sp. WAC 01375]